MFTIDDYLRESVKEEDEINPNDTDTEEDKEGFDELYQLHKEGRLKGIFNDKEEDEDDDEEDDEAWLSR
jgi:hypothetical protein